MIKIYDLDKYFNKNKSNEIHVINNVSLEFESTGLVSLLGPSGSGKTTLLNAIGGLDKTDGGKIQYDDKEFTKAKMNAFDAFRRENVGYIFQNYLLLQNETVYENLRIALELIDINDAEEQDKRIAYALKAVGLFKYRKKLAKNLSGGQQQRVSIARALLKNSKLIIADEPTGNLDSENAIEVMNILKKISKRTLVLLVTHSRNLADFYSDRIIEVKDGKIINDYINESTGTLNDKNDRKIYLKDLEEKSINSEGLNIDLFTDNSISSNNIRIVIKNNTIYLDSNQKLQLINDNNIQLIDDHYQELKVEHINEFEYDTSWFKEEKKPSLLKNIGHTFKTSFNELKHQKRKNKIFARIFFIIGAFIAPAAINTCLYTTVDASTISNEETYIFDNPAHNTQSNYYYSYSGLEFLPEDINDAIDNNVIEDIYYDTDSYSVSIEIKKNASAEKKVSTNAYKYPYYKVKDKGLIVGQEPIQGEIVVGKRVIDAVNKLLGIKYDYSFFLGKTIINYSYYGDEEFTISGISNLDTNSLYLSNYDSAYIFSPDEYYDYIEEIKKAYYGFANPNYYEYKIIDGEKLKNDNELLISESLIDEGIEIGKELLINSKLYKVVGVYESLQTYEEVTYLTLDKSLYGKVYYYGDELKTYDSVKQYCDSSMFKYEIVDGEDIKNPGECIVYYGNGTEIGQYVNDLKVVGKYCFTKDVIKPKKANNFTCLAVTNYKDYLKVNYKQRYNQEKYFECSFKTSSTAKKYFEDKNYKYQSYYEYNYQTLLTRNKEDRISAPIIIAVLLSISMVYVYFSTRAKMLNDIKDIGVYRSIGASKRQISRKYLTSLFIETSLTTLMGYVIAIAGYLVVASRMSSLGANLLVANPWLLLLGIPVIYVIDLVFGMLPIIILLKKTPAEINSKYDI